MNFTEFAPPINHNTTLNAKIWDHDSLKSSVRGALLRMAEDFEQFIGVPLSVEDIVITGGNANYTYTGDSDIDLHLIADFSGVRCDREVAELMDSKRHLYKAGHDLSIHGIPVELYVEDKAMPAQSGGCYSIVNDEWIRHPNKHIPKIDDQAIQHWVDVWHTVIKHSIQTGELAVARKTMKLLRSYRKMGLYRDPLGEFSIPNLVYKSLRNDDTIRALQKLIDVAHDRELSVQ
jgi:hypothetical protein